MKKSQKKQVIALLVLLAGWGVILHYTKINPAPPVQVVKTRTVHTAQPDNLLNSRFRKVRAEMDGLYHYRIKPVAFEPLGNPFRIAGVLEPSATSLEPPIAGSEVRRVAPTAQPQEGGQTEFGDSLLRHAIASTRIGGVVTINGTTQISINGQFHKEGDVFAAKIDSRLVLIRVRHITTSYVTLSLDDSDSGGSELRVRLK